MTVLTVYLCLPVCVATRSVSLFAVRLFRTISLNKGARLAKLYAEVDHEIQQPLGCKLLSFEFASPDQVRSLEPILLITESSRRSVFPQGMSDLEIKRPLSLRHVRGNPSRSRDIERVLLCCVSLMLSMIFFPLIMTYLYLISSSQFGLAVLQQMCPLRHHVPLCAFIF